jgi:hypothetical protein
MPAVSPESSASSTIWQLRRLVGPALRGRHVEHRVLVGRGLGKTLGPGLVDPDVAGGAGHEAAAIGLDALDAGVDRGAHQALPGLALQVVDPAIGIDQVDRDRRHGVARSG